MTLSGKSLSEIARAWDESRETERNILRRQLPGRHWLEACRIAVAHCQADEIARWRLGEGARAELLTRIGTLRVGSLHDLGTFYVAQLQACLLATQAALCNDAETVTRLVQQASQETGWPAGFYRDLVQEWRSDPRPVVATQRLGVLLVEGGDRGVLARLLLEQLNDGRGELFPAPAAAFVYRDRRCRAAEAAARQYAIRFVAAGAISTDVRWSLEGLPSAPLALRDGSLGGAFATALHLLLSDPDDLRPYLVCAQVDQFGQMAPIADSEWAVKSAAAYQAGREVAGLIIAPGQAMPAGGNPSWPWTEAATVPETVKQLRRWSAAQHKAPANTQTADDRRKAMGTAQPAPSRGVVYHYTLKAGGRVMLVWGPPAEAKGTDELDTGLIQSDFFVGGLQALLGHNRRAPDNDPSHWGQELAAALPVSVLRAQFHMRLGDGPAARTILHRVLTAEDRMGRIEAARTLAVLDPGEATAAGDALLRLIDEPDMTGGYLIAAAARVLVEIDPVQTSRVVPVLLDLIQTRRNNFLRIQAIRALVAASREQAGAAVEWLEALLADPNNEIRAKAVLALWEIDTGYTDLALEVARPLYWDSNGDVSRAASDIMMAIGARVPEAVGRLAWPWANYDLLGFTPSSVAGMREFTLAQEPEAVKTAVAKIEDLFLAQRRDVEDYTRAVAVKYAEVLLRQPGEAGHLAAVEYLLGELRQPLADRWAIYRHGCAQALPLCLGTDERVSVTARLQPLWRTEPQPHRRVALALALECLSQPSGQWTPAHRIIRANS